MSNAAFIKNMLTINNNDFASIKSFITIVSPKLKFIFLFCFLVSKVLKRKLKVQLIQVVVVNNNNNIYKFI